MFGRLLLPMTVVLALSVPAVPGAQGQTSYCAGCHFADPDAPGARHIDVWALSPHGQSQVGCERCHGGDPTTTERLAAHTGILGSANPASPVHRSNLPVTCGTCHSGPFTQFQQSRHAELLSAGDRRGPTCTTCHDAGAARLVSPRGLEQQCLQCHGPAGREPREGRAAQARLMLEGILDVRESLRATDRLIARVADPTRRQAIQDARQQAEVPLAQARQAGHRFVFDELESRLTVARDRTAVLMQLLIAPR